MVTMSEDIGTKSKLLQVPIKEKVEPRQKKDRHAEKEEEPKKEKEET
jgi:hypothetical protein